MKFSRLFFICALSIIFSESAEAKKGFLEKSIEYGVTEFKNSQSTTVDATGKIEIAFSPDEGSENLVKKVINSATNEILVLSYSFTSQPITRALLDAKRRGVNVVLVADYKNNIEEDRSGKGHAALTELKQAGCVVKTISVYPIHHDKVIIADRKTVEIGSFNFSDAAAHKNSENVEVNWNNPQLAEVYIKHFQRNYRQADNY
jgi:phosphatidylserine/phosphatidylglycerophosphate/cardiolipin synthase-like enzyme